MRNDRNSDTDSEDPSAAGRAPDAVRKGPWFVVFAFFLCVLTFAVTFSCSAILESFAERHRKPSLNLSKEKLQWLEEVGRRAQEAQEALEALEAGGPRRIAP